MLSLATHRHLRVVFGLMLVSRLAPLSHAESLAPSKAPGCIRVATYNVSLNRPRSGQLTTDLQNDHPQIQSIAAVIRTVQPDVLLINEIDFLASVDHVGMLESHYLEAEEPDLLGNPAWPLPYQYAAAVNTGLASGLDLNRNGSTQDPEDAWGYGRFPGQYGMAILSRFPIDPSQVRTLQKFLWCQLPGALRPSDSSGSYYTDATWQQLRLPSKSFWDVPVETPIGRIHLLASHPTPPSFDGPEDRNGCRNHDEIKLIQHYLEGAAFLQDDTGRPAGLSDDAPFVILGDLNSDPNDGGSRAVAIRHLLNHRRVAQFDPPSSSGSVRAAEAQGGANATHRGNSAFDTGDFSDRNVGNLRVDYVLPSADLRVAASGVFWLELRTVAADLQEAVRQCMTASDHHLVWVDVQPSPTISR